METIASELIAHGLTTTVVTDYFRRAKRSLDEAYNAAENESDINMATKVGEAKAYLDFVDAVWNNIMSIPE